MPRNRPTDDSTPFDDGAYPGDPRSEEVSADDDGASWPPWSRGLGFDFKTGEWSDKPPLWFGITVIVIILACVLGCGGTVLYGLWRAVAG